MRYDMLPGTTTRASVIALGTAWFGTAIPEVQAFALLDAYAAQGGNFLDTAHMYANWVPDGAGQSERTVGKWLKTVDRARMAIATKGADLGMTRAGIRAQLTESLERLGVASVDFYWLHVDDPSVPAGEIIEWLNELRDEWRMAAFGCSNWSPARIRAAQDYAQVHGLHGFAASQIGWSLARVNPEVAGKGMRFMDDATFAFHQSTGLPVVAYSAQAGGFFGGNYDPAGPPPGVEPNPNIVRYYGTPANYRRLAAAQHLAAARACSANRLSLAYLLHQSFPAFAIVGANTPERIADSCGAGDLVLTPEEVRMLECGVDDVTSCQSLPGV